MSQVRIASADNAAPYPHRVTLDLLGQPLSNTSWSQALQLSTMYGGGYSQSSGTQNNERVDEIVLDSGTWRMDVFHHRANARGVYQVYLSPDNSTWTAIGMFDGYQSSSGAYRTSIPDIRVATPGRYYIRFKMVNKNASSSNHYGNINQVTFVRTGDYSPREAQNHSYNAAFWLTTPTPDGSGQAMHPDVIDTVTGWNGKRYWMAMTPYPDTDSTKENPCILVSDDGQTWAAPAGLTNPVEATPGAGHYADTDLVIDGDTAYLFWTHRAEPNYYLLLSTSTDGVTWTEPVTALSGTTERFASPSIIKDGSTWKMWANEHQAHSPDMIQYRTASAPEGPWSAATDTDMVVAGRDVWHLNCFKDDDGYHAALSVCDLDSVGENGSLHIARSSDGLAWSISDPLIDPRPGYWDSSSIYRAAMDISGDDYRIWYSAENVERTWHTGYTTIPTSEAPVLP